MHLDVNAAAVRGAIKEYCAAPNFGPPEAAEGARRHDVLPLWNDFMGCIAIRPDGEVVFFSWDDVGALEVVAEIGPDQAMVHAARGFGSRRFPMLAGIAPARGPEARTCGTCKGEGVIPGVPENVVCECGGLGWVPG